MLKKDTIAEFSSPHGHNVRDQKAILSSMDLCTKCGICDAHCPVASVTGKFPGPKYTGPQAQRFRTIEPLSELSPFLCSGCGICTSVCPNNVAITDIITVAKAASLNEGTELKVGQRILNRPDLIGKLSGLLPGLSNFILNNGLLRFLIEKATGIHRDAPLPKVHGPVFKRWFTNHTQPDGPRISYFIGCSIDNFDPEVGKAMVGLLNHLGYRVDVPTDLCCSLPMLSNGEWKPTLARATNLIDALHPSTSNNTPVISTSTSCSLTIRSKYAAYLDMTDTKSRTVANAVVDACEFLREKHMDDIRKNAKELPLRVLYHGPCQLRGHHIGQPAVELLQLIPGLHLELSKADCCGVGGTYGYDKDKYDIATSIGTALIDQIKEFNPDFVICDSETCRWSIEAKSSVPSIHPVQLLVKSLSGKAII